MWDVNQVCTEEDWWEWIQRVSLKFIHESPSPAIRCMNNLAMNHAPVAYHLLNVAFLSCWERLNAKQQLAMVQKIEAVYLITLHFFILQALSCQMIEAKILHILLDLAEFMERSEKDLPLHIEKLGKLAENSHAFAKALYFLVLPCISTYQKEKEYKRHPSPKVESLITVNDHLGQHEAAAGLILITQRDFKIDIEISWFEKLQKWIKVRRTLEYLLTQRVSLLMKHDKQLIQEIQTLL